MNEWACNGLAAITYNTCGQCEFHISCIFSPGSGNSECEQKVIINKNMVPKGCTSGISFAGGWCYEVQDTNAPTNCCP